MPPSPAAPRASSAGTSNCGADAVGELARRGTHAEEEARARRRPPPRHRREEGVASAEDAAKEQEAELEENRDPQVKMPHGSGHCRRGEEPGRRHRGGE